MNIKQLPKIQASRKNASPKSSNAKSLKVQKKTSPNPRETPRLATLLGALVAIGRKTSILCKDLSKHRTTSPKLEVSSLTRAALFQIQNCRM